MSNDETGKVIDWERVRRGAVGITPIAEKPAKPRRRQPSKDVIDVRYMHDAVGCLAAYRSILESPADDVTALTAAIELAAHVSEVAKARHTTIEDAAQLLTNIAEDAIETLRVLQGYYSQIAAEATKE